MEKYISEIEKVEDKKAIDLGCGLGQDTKWLLDKGFEVLSCDISSIALEKLKELIPNSKTMQLDVKEKLPFEDNSIGLIDANLSIHYFDMKNTIKIYFKSITQFTHKISLRSTVLKVTVLKTDTQIWQNMDAIKS